MVKVLFVCHGTTLIGWDLPRETTINHDLYWNYYQFTTFLSSDMMKDKLKAVQRGRKTPLSGLLFVCLLFRPKPVLVADEHDVNQLSPWFANRGFSMSCGSNTFFKGQKYHHMLWFHQIGNRVRWWLIFKILICSRFQRWKRGRHRRKHFCRL